MKKVLMVSCEGLGLGGVQAVMMSIIRNLRDEYRFDALLFTSEARHYDAEVLSYGGKIFRIPFYEGENTLFKRADYYLRGPYLYKRLLKLFREQGPYDIVHCNNELESAMCMKAAAKLRIPVRIVHIHTVSGESNPVRECINKYYLSVIDKYATHKVACTKEAGRSFFGEHGDFMVVYNPYNAERFNPNKYGKPDHGSLVITQVGRFCDNKNQVFSLKLLKALLTRGICAELHLVGSGPAWTQIDELIRTLELESYVTLHAPDSDVPGLLNRSTAFLLPSYKEGFGIVLLEAQAMGVPCYVSDSLPRDADVGGCVFLPLSAGVDVWADKMIADFEDYGQDERKFDCSAFAEGKIMEVYRSIYSGDAF